MYMPQVLALRHTDHDRCAYVLSNRSHLFTSRLYRISITRPCYLSYIDASKRRLFLVASVEASPQ
jgi:uncharacterized RmlC-like cupin family protein